MGGEALGRGGGDAGRSDLNPTEGRTDPVGELALDTSLEFAREVFLQDDD